MGAVRIRVQTADKKQHNNPQVIPTYAHWKYVPLYTFLENWKKCTYIYDSLQFPVEMNARGSKTLITFIPFHSKYDLQVQSFD